MSKHTGEHCPQAIDISPLLRSRFEGPQEARHVCEDGLDGRALGVQAGNREARLSGVVQARAPQIQYSASCIRNCERAVGTLAVKGTLDVR